MNFSVTHIARWRREQANSNRKREAITESTPDLSPKTEIKNGDKVPLQKLIKLAPKIAPNHLMNLK